MYDNNCFHKQVCIMVEQGEGKIKAMFCNLSRAEDSISRGWWFIFLLSVWESELLTRQHHVVCSHNLAAANLCVFLQMALQAVQVWVLGRGMPPGRWGWLSLSVWEAVSCQDMQRQLADADEHEECPAFREVVGCLESHNNLVPNSFNSSLFRGFWRLRESFVWSWECFVTFV